MSHKNNKRSKEKAPQTSPRRGRGMYYSKAKNFRKSLSQILKYLGPFKYYLVGAIILSILSSLFTVLTPYISGKIITALYQFHQSGLPISEINVSIIDNIFILSFNQTLIFLLFSVVSTSVTSYLQSVIFNLIAQNVTFKMRSDLADKVNTLPLKYFDIHTYGDILNRMTTAVETVSMNLTSSLSEVFRSFTLVVSIIIMLYVLNWQLALIITASIIISLYVATRFIKYTQKYFRQRELLNSEMNGHIEEVYNGLEIVKVFNYEEKAKEIFVNQNEQMHNVTWKSQFVSGIMFPVQMFFGNLGYIAITIFGGYLVMIGALEPGFILTYVTYTRRINNPIQQLGQTGTVLQQIVAAAERVFEVLDAQSEPEEVETVDIKGIKGSVVFENVHFGYNEGQEVIKGFSASVYPGQTIAIVGPTGAGKTTIVNLLMRFYEINEGRILIDGIDIKELTRNQVRSLFGMVLQDTWLIEGSMLDNIRYGSQDKDFSEIEKASENAQIDHYIKSLPGSYNFILQEDGDNISQGQRQLITIARAMLANRPMLILDEATSSVDTRTEVLIQKAMDRLMEGRTSFVIAHRLSTIRNADLILVMDQGNIIEQGNHNDLLAKDGFYAKLYNSQFEQ